MSLHRETNPYFANPTDQDQHSQLPSVAEVPTPRRQAQDQQNQPPVPWSLRPQTQDPHSQPPPPSQDQHTERTPSSQVPRRGRAKRHDRRDQRPLGPWARLPETHNQHVPAPQSQAEHDGPKVTQLKQQPSVPQEAQVTQPKHGGQHPQSKIPGALQPQYQELQHHHHRNRPHSLRVPSPRRTKLLTWFLAGFCAIFWVVIILGGLIVLIVYLVFRPHNPRFDVSTVTLNAAYLDVGVLLNADLTLLANFTNPNNKVKIDFSYVVLDLYYGKTLIASQYVEPFSAARATSWLTNIHMVTSQVRLPSAETERLNKELKSNAVVLQVKGVFRARSNLGSFLRYSYWLYSHCTIMVTGPPDGVVRASKCITKR